ncbi:hypothetical protein [Streptomyces sp. NPDC058603]|uniref:hypothetical protein n=1 Tax=Streptomyces sp. NPDC058603 TaxID=3346551 RepID=UPI0036570FC6
MATAAAGAVPGTGVVSENGLQAQAFVRLDSRATALGGQGRKWRMGQARKIVLYAVAVFVLYTIITSPARAADLVQVGFEGISSAAQGVGEFMSELIN